MVEKALLVIRKAEMAVAMTFLSFIVALVFVAAVTRWFDFPVAWSIDVAQLLFGWVVFLGADVALKNDSHIGVDALLRKFPFRVRRTIMLANYLAVCVFLSILAYYGFYLAIDNFERLFNTLQISYSYATLSVPVGCMLMLLTVSFKIRALFAPSGVSVRESGAA